MAQSESLQLQQRIGLRLSQQQLRFVRLLELNASELDNAVQKELEENPALVINDDEPTDPQTETPPVQPRDSFAFQPSHSSYEETTYPEISSSADNLYDYLNRQIYERNLSKDIRRTALYIIGNIDSNGWLQRPLDSIISDMGLKENFHVSESDARKAFDVVRSLDPPGVGALSLQDCLSLQLERMPESQVVDDALYIINEQFESFSMKHTHKILSAMGMHQKKMEEAINLILSLNPKPGASFDSSFEDNLIIPDIIINVDGNDISIHLNNSIPSLRIDASFEQALQQLETSKEKRKRKPDFVRTRVRDAKDFIKVLSQRQQTVMIVATAIVEIQKEYFLTRDVYSLQPMMIKDIASRTGLDISVISRATANKFLSTPWGTFPMRFFFSDTIGDAEGAQAITNRKIEAEIKRLVASENKLHPLSDEKIRQMMSDTGFELSRRTVAKYRDRLEIPVARLRKKL